MGDTMDGRPALLTLLAISLPLGGCLGGDDTPTDGPLDAEPIRVPDVEFGHDHTDATIHPRIEMGLREVNSIVFEEGAFSRTVADRIEFGTGGRMARAGDLMVVYTVRDSGDPTARFQAGFALIDISDPANPVRLGNYRSNYGGSEGEAASITSDGAYAFVGIETPYSLPPVPPVIDIVDLSDPADPILVNRIPWVGNPHITNYWQGEQGEYVLVSSYQPDLVAEYELDQGGEYTNLLSVYRFERSDLSLTEVGTYQFGDRPKSPEVYFPHDPFVVQHPITNEPLLYLGAFGGGGRIMRFDEASLGPGHQLEEIGYTLEVGSASVVRHHTFLATEHVVDEIVPTGAVPRSRPADGAAYFTLYDTADPADPTFVGEWRHPDDFPPGDLPGLNMHVPRFARDGTIALIPHYHAGLIALDTSSREAMEDLQAIAFWRPDGADAQDTAPYVVNVLEAVEVDGYIYATDRNAGRLYVLELLV